MSGRSFDPADHIAGAAGMLGAAANVIMQLGHPGVGHGVVESTVDSGNVMLHPWKRLRTTMTYLVVALFGTEEDRRTYRKAVDGVHRRVRSGPGSPVKYNAFDPELQLWVAACLYVGFRDARELFLGPMEEADADALYVYCHRLGTSLQVPREDWPLDRDAFEEYWSAGLARVHYDLVVREHLLAVAGMRMLPRWMSLVTGRPNLFFTVGMLPAEVRTAMDLRWTDRRQRRFDRWIARLRTLTRLTPRWARMLPVRLQLAEFRWRVRRGWRLV